MLLVYGVLAVVVLLIAYVGAVYWREQRDHARLQAHAESQGLKLVPQVSGALPILGHLPAILATQNLLPQHMQRREKYGKVYQVLLPGKKLVFAHDPAIIKHVLSTGFNAGLYEKGLEGVERMEEFFGDGIFAANGDNWLHQRKIATPLFHASNMKTYVDIFHRNALRLFDKVGSLGKSGSVDLQDMFMRYTLDSFGEIGFGVQIDSITPEENDFARAFDFVQTWSSQRGRWGSLWKLKEKLFPPKEFLSMVKYMDEFCWSIINRRREETEDVLSAKTDLLSTLLLHNIQHPEDPYTDKQLRDMIMNFLIAGRDTTATMLTWCIYLLCQHQQVYQKLLDEIQTVLGDKELPTWENVKEMSYLKQVLQETLRLYSPVPVDGFTAKKDDVLPGGYLIEKETIVLYVNWVLNRDPEFYPDPEAFQPERWSTSPPPYSFVVFHGGPRQCLGLEMAYLEAKVMLCNLLRRFRFTLDSSKPVYPKQALILTSAKGLWVNVEEL